MFNDFEPWQWELAIVASRFRLGLLSDDEVIAFTHKLMDNGFYDDIMLDIIDDNDLYTSSELMEKFTQIFQLYKFPTLTNSQSWLINSSSLIFPFACLPFNTQLFLQNGFVKDLYFTLDENNSTYPNQNLYKIQYDSLEDIIQIIYELNEDIRFLLVEDSKLPSYIDKTVSEFLIACETWIKSNIFILNNIMHQLFPK